MCILLAAPIAPLFLVRIAAPTIKRHLTRFTVSWTWFRFAGGRPDSCPPRAAERKRSGVVMVARPKTAKGLGPRTETIARGGQRILSFQLDIVQVVVGCAC